MPEGDTVWNTAQVLERALAGRELTASDFRVPQLATARLDGWRCVESACRGKHLLLRLSTPGRATAARCTRTCGWTARGGPTRRTSAGPPGPRT